VRLIIDADACPVIETAAQIARNRNIHTVLVYDTAHEIYIQNAEVITVSRGADSADFRIVNLLESGDLVITQDYGLAAMCLGRNARVLHQDGMEYTRENIDGLLWKNRGFTEINFQFSRTVQM